MIHDCQKTEIPIAAILSHKIENRKDYSKGGFYYIFNTKTGLGYIGKSTDYMARLKSHLWKSAKTSLVDLELKKNPDDFKFYLLYDYNQMQINYFNRKLELIIEHRLMTRYNTVYPNGYNIRHYGNL